MKTALSNSIRKLAKSPGFVIVTVLVLGLGIGANTAIFSVVNTMLLHPFPYEQPDRLVIMWNTAPGVNRSSVSPPNFLDFQEQNRVFEGMASFNGTEFIVDDVSVPERIRGARVSADFFKVLGVQPMMGRTFLSSEGVKQTNVAVVTHGFWEQHFASSPTVLQQKITLNSNAYDVVGVLPADFEFSVPGFFRPADIWIINRLVHDDSQRGRNYLRVIARLKSGVTLEQASSDTNAIAGHLARQYPQVNLGLGTRLVPLREQMVGDSRKPLLLLLGAVGFVLLIGCSNIANLQLERATLRQKEIAIRVALGASRARIVRELLTESVFLAILAGIFGIGVAYVSIKVLSTTFHGVIPPAALNLLDYRILAFTLFLSFVAGIFFGIAPALQRWSSLLLPLKEGVRGTSTSPARTRFRDLLVVSEFTLSLALLIGAGLLIQSFVRVLNIPLGFETENVLLVFSSLPAYAYADRDKQIVFYQQAIEQLHHVPGVQDVGMIDDLPLTPDRDSTGFIIEGNEDPNLPLVQVRAVSPDYFRAMRISLIAGRNLSETDLATSPPVVLINQTMAKRFFAGQDPVGKHLKFSTQASVPWTTIVGVVGDVRNVGLEAPPDPEVYQPFQQNTGPVMTFVVKTSMAPETLSDSVRSTLHAMSRALPLMPTQTMEATFSSAVSARSLNTFLVGLFAAVALVLSTLGIYSVIAYSVTQRRHEIGVRMAVGAQPIDILRMILKQGAILCSIGIVLGIVLVIAMTRLFSNLLFEVDSMNPVIFVSATVLLAIIALSACVIPARRAMKVDPTESMR